MHNDAKHRFNGVNKRGIKWGRDTDVLLLSCDRRFRRKLGGHRQKETGVWTEPHPSQKAKNLCAVSVGSPAGCDAHHPGSGSHHFTWPFFLQTAGCWETEWVGFVSFRWDPRIRSHSVSSLPDIRHRLGGEETGCDARRRVSCVNGDKSGQLCWQKENMSSGQIRRSINTRQVQM